MSARPLVLVIPEPAAFPSGGNVFNARVVEGLDARLDVTVHRVVPGAALPELAPNARVLLDTLLMAEADAALAATAERGLLVHHLDLFDPATRSGARAQLERSLLGRHGFFVTTSAFSARALRELGVRGAFEVVSPGIDRELLEAAPAPRSGAAEVQLLTVANLIPRKGLLELLGSLQPLAALPWRWTVAGSERLDPEYAERFHARCVQAGLSGRVRVVEVRAGAAMRAAYDASDVLLSGARFETLGMAIREGMARALPVLAWDVGGCSESVRDGDNGYLVQPFDAEAFAARLRELIEDAPLRRMIGERARASALRFPTWEEARERFAVALAGSRN